MSELLNPQTNYLDSSGADLGKKLITKDYLLSVYPSLGTQIGIPPELWVWGDGASGKLGTNGTANSLTPVTTFSGGSVWKQVAAGSDASAAIKTDGTLWTWGFDNAVGRLGINATSSRLTPVTTFAGGSDWKQVSHGYGAHMAAIKTNGTLWVWGWVGFGQLGDNQNGINKLTPITTFAGGNNWKQVSCGQLHTAAIKTDGTLWIWGGDGDGKIGNGRTSNATFTLTPVTTFAGGNDWKFVTCGQAHTAAIKIDGTLWMWGQNGTAGRLGNNSTVTVSTPVTTFAGGNNWKQVSCGAEHTAAIKTDGSLWTWGRPFDGELGINSTFPDRLTPVTVFGGGNNWKQVSCVFLSTGAIKTDGTLWVWGRNSSGQLGINNTTAVIRTPVTTFAGGNNWKQVQIGYKHTNTIRSVDF